MKAFFNSVVGKIIVVLFATAIHGFFALGAFYLGRFISSIIFPELPVWQNSIAIGFAVMTFLGSMWIFQFGEYAYEDLEHYHMKTGKDFRWAYWVALVAIALDEVASLAYRVYTTPEIVPKFIIGAIGILALIISYCLGKIIHAMANRPAELAMDRAREHAGRSAADSALKLEKKMTPAEKDRFSRGDTSVLEDVEQREREKEQRKQNQTYEKERSAQDRKNDKLQVAEQKRQRYRENGGLVGSLFGSRSPAPKSDIDKAANGEDPRFADALSNPSGNHQSQNGRY